MLCLSHVFVNCVRNREKPAEEYILHIRQLYCHMKHSSILKYLVSKSTLSQLISHGIILAEHTFGTSSGCSRTTERCSIISLQPC
mmetsp:Transcript_44463/g.52070  ORF Transcript_44463/g.52070 Transcript_44463/m.52070 type:complete len:85 (-) Transcript_44463:171-425(-)